MRLINRLILGWLLAITGHAAIAGDMPLAPTPMPALDYEGHAGTDRHGRAGLDGGQ